MKNISKYQRSVLNQVMSISNDLGGTLDYTAVNPQKLIDRQKAHGIISNVLYYLLCDNTDNPQREIDLEMLEDDLKRLSEIRDRDYGDRYGR